MKIRSFHKTDIESVIELWKECGLVVPWNNPRLDIERKLKYQPELFLVGIIDNKIIATAMVGYDGHRGWVYYLAIRPNYQKSGFGKLMMDEAEGILTKMGCPKINIMVRDTNLDVINFYKSIGYEAQGVATLGKRLIPDK